MTTNKGGYQSSHMGDALQIAIIAKPQIWYLSFSTLKCFLIGFSQFCLLKQQDISREFLFQANNSRTVYYPLFLCDENMPINPPTPKKEKKEI